MPGKTRPIEKFAEAVAKCSAEVNNLRMQSTVHIAEVWPLSSLHILGAV